ncbi:MAG: response regulator [Proteobacteria bacterium]|nr:response regulator [Pseudomonadota bacterium]
MRQKTIEVLLVEDNPDDVEITKRAFAKGNLLNRLHIVRDGQEALDYLYGQGEYAEVPRPGLILLDINLPKVNGIDVLRKIKKDDDLREIPVVMLTVSKRDEDIVESYDLGVNSYIIKPVEFDKFMETAKNIENYWLHTNEGPK